MTVSPGSETVSLKSTVHRDRFGGTEGNEILTSAVAVVLTGLLVAEGVTVIHMGGLISAHMFIGMVLIPPALLKLASTGYRFVRYYTRIAGLPDKGSATASIAALGAGARRDHAGGAHNRRAPALGRA